MRRFVSVPLIAAALTASALSAAAQVAEPWRTPTDEPVANRARVTSSEDATKLSPAEQRAAKALAVAVFAKPAAAQRATDKIDAAAAPLVPPAEPKPEWLAKDGVALGGKGMKVTTPF